MVVTVSRIKANLKQIAIDTREKPQQLLNHELQSAPIAVAPSLSKSAVRKQNSFIGDSRADGEDSERVLLFGRERNINWSAEMQVIYMDGTFSITLEPLAQVYVILAERSARVDNGGKWLFRMIRNLWPDFRPTSFSVDFELAAIQALQETFPANNNLTIRYRDPEFSIQARMIVSLAFVPTLDVWNCLAQLEAYLPAELSPVLDYFSHYYVGQFTL
uniref:Uncharacterized protein n=1 Tax=Ditylenchus dipsaci TaxID=166011 RepID=A0A915CPZ0_9BILA